MKSVRRSIAVTELLLMFPSVLFMTALFMRRLQPLQSEPAHSAQRIVMWYAGRQWTLWVLLIALPFAVLVTGCTTLGRSWNSEVELPHAARQTLSAFHANLAMLLVAAATLTAGGVLGIVILHMLAN